MGGEPNLIDEKDLRKEFQEESGIPYLNFQGEPDIDYVFWLEARILKKVNSCTCRWDDEDMKYLNRGEECNICRKIIP